MKKLYFFMAFIFLISISNAVAYGGIGGGMMFMPTSPISENIQFEHNFYDLNSYDFACAEISMGIYVRQTLSARYTCPSDLMFDEISVKYDERRSAYRQNKLKIIAYELKDGKFKDEKLLYGAKVDTFYKEHAIIVLKKSNIGDYENYHVYDSKNMERWYDTKVTYLDDSVAFQLNGNKKYFMITVAEYEN